MSQQLAKVLARLMTDHSVSEALRRDMVEVLLAESNRPADAAHMSFAAPPMTIGDASKRLAAAGTATTVTTRKLVYVHGICRHVAEFSTPWWNALQPHLSGTFGAGELSRTRLEVLWSDIVNQASVALSAAFSAAAHPGAVASDQAWRQAAAEIREALSDRADQHMMHAAVRAEGLASAPVAATVASGLISIPGLNCIDDFSIYLTSDTVRQQIIDRFIEVVGPELHAGNELDIISHSWGTVVAYEGLRELAAQGVSAARIRNWFTVGAALSIGPVKSRLREANQDGNKPGIVNRWINLDARGDLVGGPLKDRPFKVDFDIVNLESVGCGSFLGLVNPTCAHGSYFVEANVVVNRDIFAHFINA